MKGIKQTTILLLLVGAAVGGVASAQSSGGQAPPANTMQDAAPANMGVNALQRQARELTLLNQLPEAARAGAQALLDRAETLRQDMRQLQRNTLTAYVNELKKGEAPSVARELAREAVASQRLQLLKSNVALEKDVQAFIGKYPQAKALLRQFMGASRMSGGMHRGGMPFARGQGFPGMQRGPQGPAPRGLPPAPSPQTTPRSGGGN